MPPGRPTSHGMRTSAARPRCASAASRAVRAAHLITAPYSSLSRPFVTVSGSTVRIAHYRYPLSGAIAPGVWEFASTNRGDGFDVGHIIGDIPFDEVSAMPIIRAWRVGRPGCSCSPGRRRAGSRCGATTAAASAQECRSRPQATTRRTTSPRTPPGVCMQSSRRARPTGCTSSTRPPTTARRGTRAPC